MKLKIEEAYRFARENGYSLNKKELAAKFFPNASSANANLANLFSGHTKRIETDLIVLICSEFGVCSDYLFGLTESPTGRKEDDKDICSLLDTAAKALLEIKTQIRNEKD